MKRTNLVKIKMLDDWKGVPKGTVLKAKTIGFSAVILDAPFNGIEIGKSKYKVLEILKNDK